MPLTDVTSEFSGVVGLNPWNEPCWRLNPNRVFREIPWPASKPANAIPNIRSLVLMLFCPKTAFHQLASGLPGMISFGRSEVRAYEAGSTTNEQVLVESAALQLWPLLLFGQM